jgi:upstream activation factor subunit UAF30
MAQGRKGRANPGLGQPVTPDAALARVVGKEPKPRTEITKRMWDYIKQHNLQDPNDRRTIIADDTLRPIFNGKDRVSMFEMTRLMNQHVQSD